MSLLAGLNLNLNGLLGLGGTTVSGSTSTGTVITTGTSGTPTSSGLVGGLVDDVLGHTGVTGTLDGVLGSTGVGGLVDGVLGTGSTTTGGGLLGGLLGGGSASGSGGLLDGLLGGGSSDGGTGLIPGTIDLLTGTISDLTGVLLGTNGSGGTPTNPGTPNNPGTPGLTITGTAGIDVLVGTSGNDSITGAGGNDIIDGGGGRDTVVMNGAMASFTAAAQNGVLGFHNTTTGEMTFLTSVERVNFQDHALAFDFNGSAGQVYRLYQSAFDRAPDTPGLTHNLQLVDNGTISIKGMADAFVTSPESQQLYGASVNDAQFVTNLYQNTLHRTPDAGGLTNWTNALAAHTLDRGGVLLAFSESAENHNNTDHQMQNGILLDYGVA